MRIILIISIFLPMFSFARQRNDICSFNQEVLKVALLEPKKIEVEPIKPEIADYNNQDEYAYMQLIDPSAKNNVIPELKWLAAKIKRTVARSAVEYLSWLPAGITTEENIPYIKYKNYFEHVLEKEAQKLSGMPGRNTKRAKAALRYVLTRYNEQFANDTQRFLQGQDVRALNNEQFFAMKKEALEKNLQKLNQDFYENIIEALKRKKATMQLQDKFLVHPTEKRWDDQINIFNLGIADAIKKSGKNVGLDKSWAQLYGIEQ